MVPMANRRFRPTALRVYEEVNLALWAALIAMLIFFAFFIAPHIPQYQADAEATRLADRERQDTLYCKGWGLDQKSANYTKCMSDLIELRRSIEAQFSEDLLP